MDLLTALRDRTPAHGRVAIVAAHPDDETIAAGGSLHLLPDLLLIHVTDGAPRGLGDVERSGFATPAAYAAARRAELLAALGVAQAAPTLAALDIPDQDTSLRMPAIAAELARLFDRHGVQSVLTHAYEGGHPDHDAAAFCVAQAAAGREVVEFAGYHAGEGQMVTGRFLPPPGRAADHGPDRVPLAPAEQARKRRMLDCFRTQAGILAHFGTDAELFRPAPAYNFARPPHPGPLNYERWGWPITGARWRALATEATRCAA